MHRLKGKRIVVTGGAGFLGRVVCQQLNEAGVPEDRLFVPRRREYDLTTEAACRRLYDGAFGGEPPDLVIHLAAEVGGIEANRRNPGRFFFANMAMALHLIEEFRKTGWHERGARFVQVGTVCAYPKYTPVPFAERDLWRGYPEETNAPYGVAKRAAWQMLDAYRRQYGLESVYVLPVNLYGPGDNFDLATSHVIPGLIRKCVEAQEIGSDHIACWGTGKVSREFMYVDDAAAGILRAAAVMEAPEPINLGTGEEITIRDLVALIAECAGFEGEFQWDPSRPDGQPRRCLDVQRARELLGWEAKVDLREGLGRTIDWFRSHRS